MDIEKEKNSNCKTYSKIVICGIIGAILGIIAYTNNWLG